MSNTRHKLLSLTSKDFTWNYFRGSGAGGQKRNKTSSAVRCTHEPSRSVGVAQDCRSQAKNRALAFSRCTGTEEFRKWIRLESARKAGTLDQVDQKVEQEMRKVKVEVRSPTTGRWIEV